MANKRVLVVGSAEQSGGGVASVIRLMKKMPLWDEYQCYWLGTQIQRNYIWKMWYALKAYVIGLLIIWRYDIVHFHTVPDKICLIIQMPIFLLALIGRKKIVMHIHMGNQLNNHSHNKLFKWHLRKADYIILLAKKWQSLFRELYPEIKTPTTILYNACESVPNVHFEEKKDIIIMAAYFNENKAPDLLLKAWREIKDNYPNWQIYMLGNGEIERFRYMSEEMGLEDSVHFIGYIIGKEKETMFRKASIYCMCSYEEGFPMVVLEAWAHGLCVITTPVGGLPEVLEDGKNAIVFEFGDWKMLADMLSSIINDEKKRKDIGEYAKGYVSKNFSVEKMQKQIDDIYSKLLDRDNY